MTYFISDLHLGHANIIRYCNRPFDSVEHMNTVIIDKWNARVSENDMVYLLGDFCMGSPERYRTQLNGKIHLIRGNHDRVTRQYRDCFDAVHNQLTLTINEQQLFLCHYPICDPRFAQRKPSEPVDLSFFGHVHNNVSRWQYREFHAYNVSCEVLNYQPRTFDEIVNQKDLQ